MDVNLKINICWNDLDFNWHWLIMKKKHQVFTYKMYDVIFDETVRQSPSLELSKKKEKWPVWESTHVT